MGDQRWEKWRMTERVRWKREGDEDNEGNIVQRVETI